MEELPYQRAHREAAERLKALLAKPMPVDAYSVDVDDFDPWELFPALYGSYSSDFDDMALDVLVELLTSSKVRRDLASEMFREMLCAAHLCEYGTSPRVCFPTTEFKALLPELIEKWKQYRSVMWSQQ